jgi:hypothetical protein
LVSPALRTADTLHLTRSNAAKADLESTVTMNPLRSSDQPRLSIRKWSWLLGFVFVANTVYMTSWPFVLHLAPRELQRDLVEVGTDPQTGQPVLACAVSMTYSPTAERFYWPLQYIAWEKDVPLVTPVLQWYFVGVEDRLP